MFRRAILILLLLASQSLAANKYVRSTDGNNADDGSTWALAKATLAGAFTAASAGDTIYVSDNHAETQASAMTLTSPGTAASPCRVLCVDDSAEPPTALATTATISTTGANSITFAGYAYVYGVAFQAGSSSNTAHLLLNNASVYWRFDNCGLTLNNTSATSVMLFGKTNGQTDSLFEVVNSTLTFGATGQAIRADSGFIKFIGCTLAGTGPSTLFTHSGATHGARVDVRGTNLAIVTGTLVANGTALANRFVFQDCKLGSGVTIQGATSAWPGGPIITLVNCDSADTNYRYSKSTYAGNITQESTIVRTGGATDGTTPISRKMVTTANSKYFSPLESDPILFWNETTGSNVTVTVPVITDNVTLTDAEAWVEVEYLGTSGFPITSTSTDRSTDVLASASNQTTDATSTWTTTGLTTPVKQELSVTFTPQEKGVIRARVMLAKASTTMYFDPEILTTSGRTYMVGADGQVNEGASGSNTIDPLSETIPGL